MYITILWFTTDMERSTCFRPQVIGVKDIIIAYFTLFPYYMNMHVMEKRMHV